MKTYVINGWFQKLLSALALIGLLSCGNVRANIAIQDGSPLTLVPTTTAGDNAASATTVSVTNFTVTAGANVLVVNVYDRNQVLQGAGIGTEPSTLTWNPTGTPQTLNRIEIQNNDTSHYGDSDIYALFNPTPGTATITFTDTLAGGPPSALAIQAFSLNGVNTTIAVYTNGVGNSDIDGVGFLAMDVTNVAGAWAVVNASAGDNGIGLSVTSSSGTTNWVHGASSQSQVMGVVENLAAGNNTLTAVDPTQNGTQVGFGTAIFAPLSYVFIAAPTNVVATGQTGAILLTWQDASGGAATSYNIQRSTSSIGPFSQIAATTGNTATNYTDTSVFNYTVYYYEVQAVSPGSTSAYSAPPASGFPVGVEPAPTGLAVSSLNGAAGVVWYPSLGATSYKLLQATSSGGPYSVLATPTVAIYTNTGLANGTTYYYEVEAVNGAGTGTASAYVSATPGVPNAGIAVHDGGVFSTNFVAGPSFNMNFSVTPGANTLVAALMDHNTEDTTNGSPSSIVWSNATLGTTQILTRAVSQNQQASSYEDCDLYYLWNPSPGAGVLSATDTFNNGSTANALLLQVYSLSGVDTTNFNGGVPYTASIGAFEAASLQVTTPGNTPNGSLAAVMSVNYRGGGGNMDTNTASSGIPFDFNFQVNGNQNNLGYIANLFAGVSTITATFSGAEHSALAVEVFSPLTGVGMPSPTNVVATGQTNRVAVSWDDASGGAATSYTLYRSTSYGTGYASMGTFNGQGATNYIDTAVTDWTAYYYVVTATSANGTSLFSTPPASAIPVGLPGTATGLTATNGVYSVLLSWGDVGATNFNVLRATNTPTTFGVVANVNGNAYTNPGNEATLYYYEIQPVNFYGSGGVSSAVSGIPYVTLFTNWISIPVDSTCVNGWVSNGVADAQYTTASAPPTPSQGYLLLDGYFGPGTTNDLGSLTTNLALNLSTYIEMQVDITAYAFDSAGEIQAIEFFLGCNGTNYQFFNAVGTAANGFDAMTNGQISLPASTAEAVAHYSCLMSSLTNANTALVTSLQLAVLDSLNRSGGSNEEDVGFANIEFDGAPGYTPLYLNLNNPTISPGTASVGISGTVGSPVGAGTLYLAQGTPVTVTVQGLTAQPTTISDATGDFSINYTGTAGLALGPHPITVTSATDMVSFVAGTGTGAGTLTVANVTPVPPPTIPHLGLNAAGTAVLLIATNSQVGHTYYLLQTTNLSPPVVWTTNISFAGTGSSVTNSVPINSAKDIYLKYQVN